MDLKEIKLNIEKLHEEMLKSEIINHIETEKKKYKKVLRRKSKKSSLNKKQEFIN